MAAEHLSKQELTLLHERIAETAAELKMRARIRPAGPRVPDEFFRVAEALLRSVPVTPRVIASVTALLLVTAGIAAILAVRGRRN